jgi:enoyl-CoA hydratase/carnithine racemase
MKQRTSSYIMTADPMSAGDMAQIQIIRKTVRASNALARRNHKFAVERAKYFGQPLPKAPTLYRVRLQGRGPRKTSYQDHLANGGTQVWSGFTCYLPQKYATSFDVYVNETH